MTEHLLQRRQSPLRFLLGRGIAEPKHLDDDRRLLALGGRILIRSQARLPSASLVLLEPDGSDNYQRLGVFTSRPGVLVKRRARARERRRLRLRHRRVPGLHRHPPPPLRLAGLRQPDRQRRQPHRRKRRHAHAEQPRLLHRPSLNGSYPSQIPAGSTSAFLAVYAPGTNYLIGGNIVTLAHFGDVWRKLADHYKGNSAIYGQGIMNEPQQPVGRLIYEAHCYFDDNLSGTYDSCYDGEGAYPMIGGDRVTEFVERLQESGRKGFIGEYGAPGNDSRRNTVLDNFPSYLDANGVSGTYWAGGPWWGTYPLSCEPTSDFTVDKPQMSILENYN